MDILAFDTETHLFGPCNILPQIVCCSLAYNEGLEVETFYCEECGVVRTVDVMALRNHLKVSHDYRRQDFSSYTKDFGIEFSRRGYMKQQKALQEKVISGR